MAPDDGLAQIVGALAAAPAPISTASECLLCGARFTPDQAADGGIGLHAQRCAWQRAQLRKSQLAQRLMAELERPIETPITMALRFVASAFTTAHRQLDDANFFAVLLSLYELAGELDCRVHLARQLQRTVRADSTLGSRLSDWIATTESKDGPHGA